jgi:phosphatidate phosphatase APP1
MDKQLPAKTAPTGFWTRLLGLRRRQPQVRVYHSYSDTDAVMVMGHVLRGSRLETSEDHSSSSVWNNALSMIRLFRVVPQAGAEVEVHFAGEVQRARANEQGFFQIEWPPQHPLPMGWQQVLVKALNGEAAGNRGEGRVYHPGFAPQGFISDIDDTFLISHSATLLRRIRVLLTRNPATRKPFEGVVKHYQALARKGAPTLFPNPFFYVSSSEWNLYDYIKDFCRHQELPEGIFLLSEIQSVGNLLKSGQKNHGGKEDRIRHVLEAFPNMKFVLLGDDTQRDPYIYLAIAKAFPQQVNAVYLRQRVKSHREDASRQLAEIEALGIPVCYFKHSKDALEHSKALGLA